MLNFFIISDLGNESVSLSRIKGLILKDCPQMQFIDVSHSIEEYGVIDAAFVVKNTLPALPDNAIILVYVDCYYADPADYLVVKKGEQYFLAPDNGVLSLILGDQMKEVYYLDNSDYGNWPGKIFAEAVVKIGMDFPIKKIGKKYTDFKESIPLKPIVNEHLIRATIIVVDRFGNLILNLDRKTFEEVRNNKRFSIHYQHGEPLTFLCNQYSEVLEGEVLVRFNSMKLLEIAVNHRSAVEELNLNLNDLIQIDFY